MCYRLFFTVAKTKAFILLPTYYSNLQYNVKDLCLLKIYKNSYMHLNLTGMHLGKMWI